MRAKVLAAAAAACVTALAARAEGDNARLPYGPLYHMEQIQGELAHDYTNLVVILRMTPSRTGVKPQDVSVYVDAKSGKIPVKIGPEGDFSVPMRDDLLTEKPWVVTDQPKGTMKLDWGLALAVDQVTNPTHYARLMKPVKDCSYVEQRMHEVLPNTATINITGLKITFPDSGRDAYAVIHARGGEEKIAASAQHEVLIPLKAAWMEEDPEVTFSETPSKQELAGQTSDGAGTSP